jgi:cbb3-type cytochrome oxidase maturation protein
MVLLAIIAAFFFWSVKSGQMDDLEGPAYRILMDDDSVQANAKKETQAKDEASEDESKSTNDEKP